MQNQNEHANDPLDDELFFDSMKVFGTTTRCTLRSAAERGASFWSLRGEIPI
ncbi:MAG: hypothetical protein ACLSG5_10095 [Oscillospiraceae bacterium]